MASKKDEVVQTPKTGDGAKQPQQTGGKASGEAGEAPKLVLTEKGKTGGQTGGTGLDPAHAADRPQQEGALVHGERLQTGPGG